MKRTMVALLIIALLMAAFPVTGEELAVEVFEEPMPETAAPEESELPDGELLLLFEPEEEEE